MSSGKVIHIFLDTGSVTGLRHAELVNWTGQAIACPRALVKSLSSWNESNRPGVYFLFGDDPETATMSVYIGEAENVHERLKNHLANKDFWNEVVFFTSKDDNLTKAHVKYLESRLVQTAIESGRHTIQNGTVPNAPSLPRGDLAAMEEYVGYIRTLLGVIGHKTLEPMTMQETGADLNSSGIEQVHKSGLPVFFLKGKGIEAKAVLSNEGLLVLKDSGFSQVIAGSLSKGNHKIRDSLVNDGTIVDDGGAAHFKINHIFSSPSQAASVILGSSVNGRQAWKTASGISIADLEEME